MSDDVADGLDRTLRAALADDDLAEQLLQARLTDGLSFTGFGGAQGPRLPYGQSSPWSRSRRDGPGRRPGLLPGERRSISPNRRWQRPG